MDSIWIKQTRPNIYPKLHHDTQAEIVIIGGGLTGLACAYVLSQHTTDLIVLEADRIGYGASGRNTGKISAQHGLIYADLIARYGKKIAKQYYEENKNAVDNMESIIKKHAIPCSFERCDASIYATDSKDKKALHKEYQAYLDLQIPCSYTTNAPSFPSIQDQLIMHDQARFDPYRYINGLGEILTQKGITIYEHSPVHELKTCGDNYHLFVHQYIVKAHHVVFATQFPFLDDKQFYFARMYSEQEQMLAFPNNTIQKQMLLHGGEHLIKSIHAYQDKILITGNTHKSGQMKKDSYSKFKTAAQQLIKENCLLQWSSQDYSTFDKLPMIGYLAKESEHLYVATGFQKWGNTTSHIAAKRIASMILQLPCKENIFAPKRLSSFLSLAFVKENSNVLYEFLKRKSKIDNIALPMQKDAKCIQLDDHLYGIYRDEHDEFFIVDITCPHAGCICNFNPIDHTWDCPCHGSRFSYRGEIIKGPSQYRLHAYGDGYNEIDPHFLLSDDEVK